MLRDNRFRLITLGRLTLLGSAGEEDAPLAKRRRKLALLAVLAMARRPLARDTLLGMFWGEEDEARARHSLSNALSSLRRSLGQRAITTRDADVALSAEVTLDVDALELSEAVEGRDFARAIEVYGGPFLEGMHIDESHGFEQWVTRERRRLEALFINACAQQCAMLARARRWPECHVIAARWLDTQPLSSDAAIYLLNATKAPATRAALAQALEEYEAIRLRLSREFELVPEPALRELAERMREQLGSIAPEPEPVATAAVAPSPAPAGAASAPEPPIVSPVATPAPSPGPSPAPSASNHAPNASLTTTASHRARPRRLWSLVAAAPALIAVALLVLTRGRAGTSNALSASTSRKPSIAVLAMDVRATDSSLSWLSEGLPQMISGKLAHNSGVDVVPESRVLAVLARSGHARNDPLPEETARDLAGRIGASLVARGSVARDGDNLVLDLTVRDVSSGNLLHNAVLTHKDALALADEAAARILGAANVSAPGPRMAGLETSSLEAYQHYMRALEEAQAGRISEYSRELDAAVALDSGFIAVVRSRRDLAISALDTALVRRLGETLRRHADRATEFDRMYQEATDAHYAGEHEKSEALARAVLRRYPRDPRSYNLLESVLESHGKMDEAERIAVQGLALDSLAMEAGSGPCSQCLGYFTILSLHWARADFRGAADWARRWIRSQPDGAPAWDALAWTFAYMQLPDSAVPVMQRAISLSGGDLWAARDLPRIFLLSRRYDVADSVITTLETSTDPARREEGFDLRWLLDRERGRFREANHALDQLDAVSPSSATFTEMMRADNLRVLGDYVGASRRYEGTSHAPGERLSLPLLPAMARAFCWHHALAADAYAPTGDTIRLRAVADTLERGCVSSYYFRDWRLHHHVRGLIAMRRRDFAEAEREFKAAVTAPTDGWGRTTVELAAAQLSLGNARDAIATLRTAYATRLDAMGRYVPVSEMDYRMALAFAQAGEKDSARVYAGYVRSAWRNADPEIRRLLEGLPK